MIDANLTDKEFVRWQSHVATDPIILRLCKIIDDICGLEIPLKETDISEHILDYNPDALVTEYIYDLLSVIKNNNTDLSELYDKVSNLESEIERLKSMTMLEFITQLQKKIIDITIENSRLEKDALKARENENAMKSKLDMWAIMNR